MSESFSDHLKRASEVVATWPVWKQEALGRALGKVFDEPPVQKPTPLELEHKELAFALLDIMDGTYTDYDLQGDLGSPIERCREILALRDRMMLTYREAWLNKM